MEISKITKAMAIISLIMLYSCSSGVQSSNEVAQNDSQIAKQETAISKPKLIIAKATFGPEAKDKISGTRIEAALILANQLGKKYDYIDTRTRDSVIKELRTENPKFTNDDFNKRINADKLYFIQTDLMANMLRVQLSTANPKTGETNEGVGYALVHYFQEKDNAPVYDPALLKAMQRAIAVCEKDSTLYAKNDTLLFAIPAPTLVISGIEYKNNTDYKLWELFTNQEVNSYFALESIYDTLKHRKDVVLYDLASRDSIYSLFNLQVPDNQRATNQTEFSCLAKLEVEYVISGSFTRTETGATLVLLLNRIKDNRVSFVSKASVEIDEDSRIKFKEKVQSAAVELMNKSIGIAFPKIEGRN